MLAITETWLPPNRDDDLQNACPAGFTGLHVPRTNSSGGGVAVIYRSSIEASFQEPLAIKPKSFEYLGVVLNINSVSIRLVVVYRPPKVPGLSDALSIFLDEFSSLPVIVSSLPGRLLIVGDFNFHLDVPGNSLARRFSSMLHNFGLDQHVQGATHKDGHLLALVISRSGDNLVQDCSIGDLFSCDFSIKTTLKAHRPLPPILSKKSRPISKVCIDDFIDDLSRVPLVTGPSPSLDNMVSQYHSDSLSVLDRHAPVAQRKYALRPDNPCFTRDISAARRLCHRVERILRRRHLEVDSSRVSIEPQQVYR